MFLSSCAHHGDLFLDERIKKVLEDIMYVGTQLPKLVLLMASISGSLYC